MTMSTLIQYPTSCHGQGRGSNTSAQGDEATSSLLNFVDMASSNIKLALDKPVKSKRKVNHRKYLQKQLKRCNSTVKQGMVNKDKDDLVSEPGSPVGSTPVPVISASPSIAGHAQVGTKSARKENTQVGLQNKSLAALFDPRTLHERCCADPPPRGGSSKVPLRKRNLPASFFTEPVSAQLSREHQHHMSQFPPGVYSSGQEYLQAASSCRHAGGGCRDTPHDSVDQMLNGQVENGEFHDFMTETWQDEGRSSANTTPCSMTSSTGGAGAHGDILETALNAAAVGGGLNCSSPVSMPATGPVTSWSSVYQGTPSPTAACAVSAAGGIPTQPHSQCHQNSSRENTPVAASYPPQLHHIDTPTDAQTVIRHGRLGHQQNLQNHQGVVHNQQHQHQLHGHHQNIHSHHHHQEDGAHSLLHSVPMQPPASPTHLASSTASSSPTSPFLGHHQPLHIQTSITTAELHPRIQPQPQQHHHQHHHQHHPEASSIPLGMNVYQSNKTSPYDGFSAQLNMNTNMNMNTLPVSIPTGLEGSANSYSYHDPPAGAMTNFWQGAAMYGQLQSCYTYL